MDLLHISPLRVLSTESCSSAFYDEKEEKSSFVNLCHENIGSDYNSLTPVINKRNLNYSENKPKSTDIESQILKNEEKINITDIINSPNTRRKRIGSSFSSLGHRFSSQRTKFYKQKLAIFNFLQRPKGVLAIGYHILVSCTVLICLVLNVLSTIKEHEITATNGLKYMDFLIVVLFGVEFVARFWSSSCLAHYRGWNGAFRFLCNPFRIFDIFVIITSTIVLFFDIEGQILSTFLKGFRFFQVFGMFRLEHKFRPWRLMASVVWDQREHLSITAYMGFLALLFVSFIVYFAEKDVNPDFRSIANALWWGVVTFCTVGYGEITPITSVGKFLSCFCIIIGVSLFALPAGILGAGLALKVEEQQHKRQIGKRRQPAANLIQSSWRFYVISENSLSSITWKRYLIPNTKLKFLTNRQKNAIKFICVVKLLVAKRRFNTAFKPYDIKDVLEQYAAGHADVSGRVKHMQCRMSTVQSVVNSNTKTLYESNAIITSHLSKMESNVYDLQLRLDELIERQVRDNSVITTLKALLSDKKEIENSNSNKFKLLRIRRKSY